jgi:hypothetical protein
MTEVVQPRGKVRLFACGGAGLNIGSSLENKAPQADVAYAQLDITYVDTSKSNLLGRAVNQANVYLVGESDAGEEKDGAGKDRATHYEDIKDCAPSIIQKYPAGDLAIVVSSASGGSGAMIAAELVKNLLLANKPVIAVMIGTTTSVTELKNTIKAFKTYEGVSKAQNKPITMAYYQNTAETPRHVVNDEVRRMIASIMMLYSRQNAELDAQDLNNWLNFDKKTSFEPQLAALQVLDHGSRDKVEGDVISIATLSVAGKDSTLGVIPEYHCEGFVTAPVKQVAAVLPRHYYITSNFFTRTHRALLKLIDDIEAQQSARTKRSSILSKDDRVDDSGVCV